MRRTAFCIGTLSCLIIIGCGEDRELPRDRNSGWSANEPEHLDKQQTQAALWFRFGTEFDVPADSDPRPGFPQLPDVQKPVENVAVAGNPVVRNVVPREIEVERPQQRPIVVPVVEHKAVKIAAEKKPAQPAVLAQQPKIVTPLKKRASSLDWHTTIPAALKEASASPGGGKPVLCFRVLGDVTGFM